MIHDFYLQCALALGSKWWKIKKSLRPQEVCNLMGPLALIAMRRLESGWVVAESYRQCSGIKGNVVIVIPGSTERVLTEARHVCSNRSPWKERVFYRDMAPGICFGWILLCVLCFFFCLSWFFSLLPFQVT